MSRRLVLFVVALVVCLAGVGTVYAYASSADTRATRNQTLVSVLVARTTIKAGTSAADARSQVTTKRIAQASLPDQPLASLAQLGDQSVDTDVYPGEVLQAAMFASSDKVAGTAGDQLLAVPAGKLAMSVELKDKERVGGFVKPGDLVAIYVTSGNDKSAAVTRLLFPKVEVLAVGTVSTKGVQPKPAGTAGSQQSATVPTTVLTVAVDLQQGALLAHASELGTLTFGLETNKTTVSGQTSTVTNGDVFGAGAK